MARVPEPLYLSTFSMNQLTSSLNLARAHLVELKRWGVRLKRKRASAKGNTGVLFDPEIKSQQQAVKETEQRISDLVEAIRIKRKK